MELLILAAHPLELADLRMRLSEAPPLPAGERVGTGEVGVGLAAAGAGTALALARHRPKKAVLIGSAGHYPDSGLGLGEVVVASEIMLVDGAVTTGKAACPGTMTTQLPADTALATALSGPTGEPGARPESPGTATAAPGLRKVGVATTLAITTDDDLAVHLGAAGPWQVENLEAFAVALACKAAGVPFSALLGITNAVGARGRAQWREHHEPVARRVAALVASFAHHSR